MTFGFSWEAQAQRTFAVGDQIKEPAEPEPELRPGSPQRCGGGTLLCRKKTQEIRVWVWEVENTGVEVPLSFRKPRRGVVSQRSPV